MVNMDYRIRFVRQTQVVSCDKNLLPLSGMELRDLARGDLYKEKFIPCFSWVFYFQLPSTQISQYAKVTYLGVAYLDPNYSKLNLAF